MSTQDNEKEIMNALKLKESGVMMEQILHAHTTHKDEVTEIFSVIDKLRNESSRLSPSPASLHQTLKAIELKNKHSWSWSRVFVPLAFTVLVVGIFIWKPSAIDFGTSNSKVTSGPQTLQETAVAFQNEDATFVEPADFSSDNDIKLVSSDFEDNNLASLYDSSL